MLDPVIIIFSFNMSNYLNLLFLIIKLVPISPVSLMITTKTYNKKQSLCIQTTENTYLRPTKDMCKYTETNSE